MLRDRPVRASELRHAVEGTRTILTNLIAKTFQGWEDLFKDEELILAV